MEDEFFLEDLISFVLRYPDHRHYVGVKTIALRQRLAARLTAASLKTRACAGAAFNGDALNQIDTGEINVLLTNPDQLCLGWYTPADMRTISFLSPIDCATYEQGKYRLRGAECRIGFATVNKVFQDQPIKNIYHDNSTVPKGSARAGDQAKGRPPGPPTGWRA